MKKILIFIALFFSSSLMFGQIGFLGKRSYFSTDIFNALNQGKYNLSYQFCTNNNVMLMASFSKFAKTYEVLDVQVDHYYDEILKKDLTIESSDISFNGFSWEIGFNYGYHFFTGMPMPIGYYMGLSFEHLSGDMVESSRVTSNYITIMNDKKFNYKNKANIFKVTYGKNSIITKSLVLNTSLQLGVIIGNTVNPDYTAESKPPEMFLPKSLPFQKKPKFEFGYSVSEKNEYFFLYIMPQISIGYIF